MKGITVKQLCQECQKQVNKGNENKIILISDDDEGNGFHTLFYGFTDEDDDVDSLKDLFHDGNNPDDVVLLG